MPKRLIAWLCSCMLLFALCGACAGYAAEADTLSPGSRGEEVRRLQQALVEGGYGAGAADGIYGNATAAAVRAFQADAGLPITGEADPATQRALYGENEPTPEPSPSPTPAIPSPMDITLSGVSQTDVLTINGLFVDASWRDPDDRTLARLYLFYTVEARGRSLTVDSRDSTLTFGETACAASHAKQACLYMGSYSYRDGAQQVAEGERLNVVETYVVPTSALKSGQSIAFMNHWIRDCERISLITDDIYQLDDAKAIAEAIDPEGAAMRAAALSEADAEMSSRALDALNGKAFDVSTGRVNDHFEFHRDRYAQINKLGSFTVPTQGSITVCNGYLILENGTTGGVIYVPYRWEDGEILLSIEDAMNPDVD